ncbi:peptidylprolyl isomerase [Hyphomicrobium sp.]|uniref:peptidylprolyl isomerase n=1 Tax=Hyphomicrobium sp. TaxID=82 RepID=UPI001D722A9D|nr:peptidylprolyl isomerase [Hyphomicrobium sp.]MBY0562363.1 peptidyl-prolyl cis-trans isomerase [Hyphomicrobium sp.]
MTFTPPADGRTMPSTDVPRNSAFASLAREPLLHFLLIGALLFAVHAAVTPSVSKERLIEVTPEVRQSIIDLYKEKHDIEPSKAELSRLIDNWILNEVTYREALAQGLDRGDDMIRERIMQKMRLLVFGNVNVEEPTQQQLSEWFEERRGQYDVPDFVSFFEVPFTGPEAETQAKTTLQQIESGSEPEEVRLRAQIFADRPKPSLESSFGKTFVDQIAALPVGKWTALQSAAGWHIIRLDSFVPGHAVRMDEIQTQLINEWKDDRARRLGVAAIRDMAKAYVVKRGEP